MALALWYRWAVWRSLLQVANIAFVGVLVASHAQRRMISKVTVGCFLWLALSP
jgi:hypothetical protein